VITASTSAIAWFAADALGRVNDSAGWVPYWNAFATSVEFALIAVLLSRGKQLDRRLKEQTNALTLAIEQRSRTEVDRGDEKKILRQIAEDGPLHEILDQLSRMMEQWSQGMLCSILLFDAGSGGFSCAAAPNLPRRFHRELQRMCAERTFCDTAAANTLREAFSSPMATHGVWAKLRQSAAQHGICARCSKAIISAFGDPLGLLAVFSRLGDPAPVPESGLLEEACEIAAIAIERARLKEEPRNFSERIFEAQEVVRRQIARELHDSVNQILSSVSFRISMIDSQIPHANPEIKEEFEQTKQLLNKGIDEIRRISDHLRPGELDALGLLPAIRSLCDEYQKKSNFALTLNFGSWPNRLPEKVELGLYRIIQEAFTNIEKHSGASQVSVQLDWDGAFLKLRIEDNGKGFESASGRLPRSSTTGMGLGNMRERSAFLEGSFSIRSARNQGTQISVHIPFVET
jgi:signal transduction histidine kinase